MTFDTDAINNIKFTQGFRGYDTAEVDEFLDDMIREIEKLNNTIKNLKDELSKEKRKNQLNQQEIDRLTQMNESLSVSSETVAEKIIEEPVIKEEKEPVKLGKITSMEDIKGTREYEEMKQILTDTLFSAQQHAEKLVKDAKERANKLIEEGEREASEKMGVLKAEIRKNEDKLLTVTSMVKEAKKRFKKSFQDQIIAIDNIDTGEKDNNAEEEIGELPLKEQITPDAEEEQLFKTELPSLDDIITEKIEEKKEEIKREAEPQEREVSKFDFAAIKKSMSKDDKTEETSTVEPETKKEEKIDSPDAAGKMPDEEEENKQYIEIALSAYNDNKHHNTDYPNSTSDIKINEDDENGGIYQPENRSVLSSVIEEILNNKRNED